ncbi:Mitochondrial pyruvate carrier, partial [Dillenia turbinata]
MKIECELGLDNILANFYEAVHFWAPTFKWGLSLANVADFSKPPEQPSYPQQGYGYCYQRTNLSTVQHNCYPGEFPSLKSWNLFGVIVRMAATGLYLLARKFQLSSYMMPLNLKSSS